MLEAAHQPLKAVIIHKTHTESQNSALNKVLCKDWLKRIADTWNMVAIADEDEAVLAIN